MRTVRAHPLFASVLAIAALSLTACGSGAPGATPNSSASNPAAPHAPLADAPADAPSATDDFQLFSEKDQYCLYVMAHLMLGSVIASEGYLVSAANKLGPGGATGVTDAGVNQALGDYRKYPPILQPNVRDLIGTTERMQKAKSPDQWNAMMLEWKRELAPVGQWYKLNCRAQQPS